jgi:hypothetical protein
MSAPVSNTITASMPTTNKDHQQRNQQEAGHYVVTSHRASSVTDALRCSFLGPDTTVRPFSSDTKNVLHFISAT